jgi:hypothetical protein
MANPINLLRWRLSGAFLATALAGTPVLNAAIPAELAPGLISGAEVQVYMDIQSMADSAFFKTINDKFGSKIEEGMDAETKALLEKSGINIESMQAFALSIPNVMAMQGNPADAAFAMAMKMAGSVEPGAIKNAIQENMEDGITLQDAGRVGRFETFRPSRVLEDSPAVRLGLNSARNITTMLMAAESVFDSLAEARQVPAQVSEVNALSGRVLSGNQGWISLTLSPEMKGMLKQQLADGMGGMPGTEALEGLDQVLIGLSADDGLNLNIGLKLSSNQQAEDITNLLRFSLIGMARMMVAQQFGNNPPPFFQSLAAAQEGNTAVLKTRITMQDIEIFSGMAGAFIPGL